MQKNNTQKAITTTMYKNNYTTWISHILSKYSSLVHYSQRNQYALSYNDQ